MKKIALVVMLLATSAFAGINLGITPNPVVVAPDGTFDVTFSTPAAGGTIDGYSIFAKTGTGIGFLKVTAVADQTGILTDRNNATTQVGKLLSAIQDLGYTAGDPSTGVASGNLVKYTLQVQPGAPLAMTVNFTGGTTLWSEADGMGVDGPAFNAAALNVTLTPEPTSMLLLAAGAAFFARRRRA